VPYRGTDVCELNPRHIRSKVLLSGLGVPRFTPAIAQCDVIHALCCSKLNDSGIVESIADINESLWWSGCSLAILFTLVVFVQALVKPSVEESPRVP
jgi:hypothetical protein